MGQFFGLIPAAGRSRRMGEHKLLLPWQDRRVVDVVVSAWAGSLATQTVFVVRDDDVELQNAIASSGMRICILNQETADMKETIQKGLLFIQEQWSPGSDDFCLIAPADLPKVSSELLNKVVEAAMQQQQIVVPYFGAKSGHPVAFPWSKTDGIFRLDREQGINALLNDSDVFRLELDASDRVRDIDTPEEYERERKESP